MAQNTLSAKEQRMVALVHDIYVTAEGIETSLFRIFAGLAHGPYHQSKAIFYSQLNPRGRRDMISALALVSMRNEPDETKTLNKLIERAKKATSKRNTVAHGEWQTYADGTIEEYRRSTVSPDMMKEVELSEQQLSGLAAGPCGMPASDRDARTRAAWMGAGGSPRNGAEPVLKPPARLFN